MIDSPQLYRHILAVTFTNKATEEMKQRIVGELNALANGSPSGYMGDLERDLGLDGQTIRRRAADARTKILHDYSRFTVLTIDKFFQRIIRSFIKELGIDLNFNLELQTDSILDSATDRLIDRIAVDRALRDWVCTSWRKRSTRTAAGTSAAKFRNWAASCSENDTARYPATRHRAKSCRASFRRQSPGAAGSKTK